MSDQDLIIAHGGATKLAIKLGYDLKKGGAQRVQNWFERGIPPKVKLDRPDLFLPDLVEQLKKAQSSPKSSASKKRRASDKEPAA